MSEVLQVRCPGDLAKRFREEAKSKGVSMGFLLQLLLDGKGGEAQASASPDLERRIADLEKRLSTIERMPRQVKPPARPKMSPARPAQARRARAPKPLGQNESGAQLVRVDGPNARPDKVTVAEAERLKNYPEGLPKTPAELKEMRAGLGLGRYAMAELLGVTQSSYQHWEKDHIRIGGKARLVLMDWHEAGRPS